MGCPGSTQTDMLKNGCENVDVVEFAVETLRDVEQAVYAATSKLFMLRSTKEATRTKRSSLVCMEQ